MPPPWPCAGLGSIAPFTQLRLRTNRSAVRVAEKRRPWCRPARRPCGLHHFDVLHPRRLALQRDDPERAALGASRGSAPAPPPARPRCPRHRTAGRARPARPPAGCAPAAPPRTPDPRDWRGRSVAGLHAQLVEPALGAQDGLGPARPRASAAGIARRRRALARGPRPERRPDPPPRTPAARRRGRSAWAARIAAVRGRRPPPARGFDSASLPMAHPGLIPTAG